MAVKIRLKRMGKIRAPFYRVVVMDSRTKRDGRAIEEIGKYHPTESPSLIEISSERAQYWLTRGAQPTDAVAALLKVTGDWQRYTGQPGAEGTLQVKPPARSKKELYEAAMAASGKTLEVKGDPAARRRSRPAAEDAAPAEASGGVTTTGPDAAGPADAADAGAQSGTTGPDAGSEAGT